MSLGSRFQKPSTQSLKVEVLPESPTACAGVPEGPPLGATPFHFKLASKLLYIQLLLRGCLL